MDDDTRNNETVTDANEERASGVSTRSIPGIDRRVFLGAILTGAAGVAVTGAAPSAANTAVQRRLGLTRKAARLADAKRRTPKYGVRVGPQFGPDGFPLWSIQGTFIGSQGNAMLVAAGNGSRTISVQITGSTNVWVRGTNVTGDITAFVPGDFVQSGTYFDETTRIAQFAIANPLATWMIAADSGSDDYVDVNWQNESSSQYNANGWPWGGLTATSFTKVIDGETGDDLGGMSAIKAGDFLHATTMTDLPGKDWNTAWPIVIRDFGTPPAGFSMM